MLDQHVPELPIEHGVRLTRPEYHHEFWSHERSVHNGSSWKLERRQHFEETGSASRDALRRGDWDEALRLFAAREDTLRAEGEEDARRGSVLHRLRVVEEPLTPYIQWELHSLHQKARFGAPTRVVLASALAAAEAAGPLPELVAIGDRILFRVMYTDTGVPDGAIRFTDPAVVNAWVEFMSGLFATAEDIASYFPRAVAPLPPPPAA
ncbi:DUF6879 family protein [Streptomyces sp. NRRL F-5123]|uniref:DUF6879 family protein n=1 Tax=Streptomyces sp. NRRL F-5123 TaxID=1463856 RepID=UPI0004E1815C|nr:DUF6879 family protein [Streptomyces sp. NRRL F-5123]